MQSAPSGMQLRSAPTFTAGTALVEREPPLAFTGEASGSVLADALGPTQVDVGGALIVIWGKHGRRK